MHAENKVLRPSKTLFRSINLCEFAHQTQCCWPNACVWFILTWARASRDNDFALVPGQSSFDLQGLLRLLFFHRALAGWLLCFVLFLLLVCGWTIIKAAVTLLYTAAVESRAEKRAFRPNCGAKPRAEASRGPPLLDAMLTGVELFFERCWFITLCISHRTALYVLARGYSACIMPHYKFSIFNLEK